MFRRNGKRFAEPQRVKFEHFIGRIFVDFVHHQNDRLFAAAEYVRHVVIGGGKPLSAVGEKQNHVRGIDSHVRLFENFAPHRIFRFQFDAARIHHGEFFAAPFRVGIQPIARNAGAIFRDGDFSACHFIEKRAFPHVGAPHEGDQRICHDYFSVLLLYPVLSELIFVPVYYTLFFRFCKEKRRTIAKIAAFSEKFQRFCLLD